jgi:hypothetical protein
MGIKGLPEQLKHYYRDAQVEQFKGMNTQSRIFKTTFVVSDLVSLCFASRYSKLTQRRTIVLFLFTSSSTNRFARTKRIGWNV